MDISSEIRLQNLSLDKIQKVARDISSGQRSDNRSHNTMRPVFLKVDLIKQARGSSYIEMGQTKIVCAVYGPREMGPKDSFSMKGQISCEFKFPAFASSQSNQLQLTYDEKSYSEQISQALSSAIRLEKFPKAILEISVTVLEHDGSCLAAALTCASLAVVDAGIEMFDLVIGASLLCIEQTTLIDPTKSEEAVLFKTTNKISDMQGPAGLITVGYMPTLQQVGLLLHQGLLDVQAASEGVRMCIDAAHQLFPTVQQCLLKVVKMQTRLSSS